MRTKNEGTLPPISEAEWQTKVIDTAHLYGWQVVHFRQAKTQRKDGSVFHQTPVGVDAKGFPDLILVSIQGGILFRELKTDRGKCSPEQTRWLHWLNSSGADVKVWRPSDWPEVLETLDRQTTGIRRV